MDGFLESPVPCHEAGEQFSLNANELSVENADPVTDGERPPGSFKEGPSTLERTKHAAICSRAMNLPAFTKAFVCGSVFHVRFDRGTITDVLSFQGKCPMTALAEPPSLSMFDRFR